MDCLAMEFESQTFDCVIDKGTLDTVLSGEYSGVNSSKMLKELNRVLKPKGVYICVTYGVPDNRTPILKKVSFRFSFFFLIKKIVFIYSIFCC